MLVIVTGKTVSLFTFLTKEAATLHLPVSLRTRKQVEDFKTAVDDVLEQNRDLCHLTFDWSHLKTLSEVGFSALVEIRDAVTAKKDGSVSGVGFQGLDDIKMTAKVVREFF